MLALLFANSELALAMNPFVDLRICEAQLLGHEDETFGLADYRKVEAWPGITLEGLFERVFQTNLYSDNLCGLTVRAFLEFAIEKKVDLAGTSVLWVGPVAPERKLPVRAARGFREAGWEFHFAVLKDGKILDLYFGNRARIVSVAEYHERMFGADPKVRVRLIPVAEFLPPSATIDSVLSPAAREKFELGQYPELLLSELALRP